MDLVSLCLAGLSNEILFPEMPKAFFFNPALMYGHLSVIVSTVASLSAVNVSVISGMTFQFKGSPHAFNFNSCTSEFCFSFKKKKYGSSHYLTVIVEALQEPLHKQLVLYQTSFFFSEVRAHGLLFLIWLMKQVSFYRGLFFSYASLLKLMLPCRDNRVAAGQNMTEPHKLNTRKTDFIRFGKVIYVSEHVSL